MPEVALELGLDPNVILNKNSAKSGKPKKEDHDEEDDVAEASMNVDDDFKREIRL